MSDNLPQIPTPTSCGGSSSAVGWTPSPTDDSHNHDDIYFRESEVDCAVGAARAQIIGTPSSSICTDCDALAGYAISTDPEASPILEILEYEQGGVGPFSIPQVTSLVVDDDKVTVTWGPTDNGAVISLGVIAEAIAADPQSAALMRIAVCDCSTFEAFTSGEIQLTVALNDAPSDGTEYVRKDGAWVNPAKSYGGIKEDSKIVENLGQADVLLNETMPSNMVDPSSGILTIPVGGAGDYSITMSASIYNSLVTDVLVSSGIRIVSDGGGEDVRMTEPIEIGANAASQISLTTILTLADLDEINFRLLAPDEVALTVTLTSTGIAMHRVS